MATKNRKWPKHVVRQPSRFSAPPNWLANQDRRTSNLASKSLIDWERIEDYKGFLVLYQICTHAKISHLVSQQAVNKLCSHCLSQAVNKFVTTCYQLKQSCRHYQTCCKVVSNKSDTVMI
jgi:hypothetical protein